MYPGALKNFQSAKLPLKVGIRADILAAMPDVEPKLIEAALREYCYRSDYQRYLTEGAGRVNLQGEVVGTVGVLVPTANHEPRRGAELVGVAQRAASATWRTP